MLQIIQMRRDHHALLWLEPQLLRSAEVDLRTGLVGLEHLSREDMREGHIAVLDHVGEERDVAVAEGAGRELLVQQADAFGGVWPRVEVVPNETEFDDLLVSPERAVVLSRGNESMFGEELAKGIKVVLIDGLVRDVWIICD